MRILINIINNKKNNFYFFSTIMSHLIEDCLSIILNKLKDSPDSLYSCILVNRFWCCVAMPILWKNPFVITNSHDKLYNIIIHLFPKSSKQLLFDNGIELPLPLFSNQPLFNYISFSTIISPDFINNMTCALIDKTDEHLESYGRFLLEQEVYKLFVNNCMSIKYFYWKTAQSLHQYQGASTCFSQLRTLEINLRFVTSVALFGMAEICQNIKSLKLWNYNRDIPDLIRFIDVQKNLQSLILHFDSVEKQCIQLSEVIKRKAPTLKKFIIGPDITSLSPKFFPFLTNLQYLELNSSGYRMNSVGIEEWKECFSIASFPNLRYFESILLPICNDYMLIEKSHGDILVIYIYRETQDFNYTKKLIETIAQYCPKLKKLAIDAEIENLGSIKEILINCKQLETIELTAINLEGRNGDNLLKVLINYSSNTLYKVTFENWIFSVNELEFFFTNWEKSEREPIIFNIRGHVTDNHKMIVQKYIDMNVIKEAHYF